MDVTFETSTRRHFTIEIGFFDTVLEIKEKIQRYEGYPISSQKLFFRGQELIDTEHYEILQGSRLQLIIVEPDEGSPREAENVGRVHVIVRIPILRRLLLLEADVMESVTRLKERIQELERVSAKRIRLFYGSNELHDTRVLADYGVAEHSQVKVVIRSLLSTPTT